MIVNVSDLFWQSSWPFDKRNWIAPFLYTPPSFEFFRSNRDPAMEAVMDIRIKRDAPDFAAGPANPGDRFRFHFAALYTLRANKIAQLRIFGLSIEKQAAG